MTTSSITSEAEEILSRLVRVVRRADAFVLGFVKCNSPSQRQQLSRAFLERLSGKRNLEITLDEPIVSLLERLAPVIDAADPPDVVNIYGLEKSIYAHEDYSPALGRLNNDRDLIRRACPTVLLLWLPDYALDKVAISAPDFWAWRSGVYELPTLDYLWRSDSSSALAGDLAEFQSLSRVEKIAEVERVEELLRTAQNLVQQDQQDQEIAVRLMVKSALLRIGLGEYDFSCQRLYDALALAESMGNKHLCHLIGRMLAEQQYQLGNISQAEQLFLHSVEDIDGFTDPQGSIAGYFRLAEIAEQRGDIDKAKAYYYRIAALPTAAANSTTALAILAHLHQQKGELEEAFNIYQQMLRQFELSDDKLKVASTLRQIGTLELQRGNLIEAKDKVSGALSIFEAFDESQAAITYGMLGQIEAEHGNEHAAFVNFCNAWKICHRLHLPNARLAIQSIISLGQKFGTDQFEQWIKETDADEQQFFDELHREYDQIILKSVCSRVAAALKSNDAVAKEQLVQELKVQFAGLDVDVGGKTFYNALRELLKGKQPSDTSRNLSPKYKEIFDKVWQS